MQTLSITWRGQALEFKPSFDLFLQIEEKVSFTRIQDALSQAAQGKPAEIPMSHVAWVLYCCLKHAGGAVRTPMDVHQALFSNDGALDHSGVLRGLAIAYFGAQPEKPPKKKPATPAKPSKL
jgi:hypothetical protein